MQRLIVGNWKMNMDPHQASLYLHRLAPKLPMKPESEIVICAPTLDLYSLARDIDKTKLSLGAQDVHYADHGAFTGETSPAMLKGLVKYSIIGHSERRAAGESDKLIAKKVAACFRNEITPILCVGENLNDREHALTAKVVTDQLAAALHDVTASDVAELVVAYEPVWAIGTGQAAVPDLVTPVVAKIRETLEEVYGEEGGSSARILYGGSVTAHNAAAYLAITGIDGLFVGSTSLNYEDFANIIAVSK